MIERYAAVLNSISCFYVSYLNPILWYILHLPQWDPTQFLNPWFQILLFSVLFFHFFQTTQNTRGLQFWRPSIHRLNTWLSLDFGHVCTWVRTAARSPTFERTPSGPLKRLSHYALPPSTDAAEPTDMSCCCWSHNNLCQNQVSQKVQEEGWTWGFGATAVNINFGH